MNSGYISASKSVCLRYNIAFVNRIFLEIRCPKADSLFSLNDILKYDKRIVKVTCINFPLAQ